jgi:flagella basal body P-ring formation protein FlgA
MIKFTRPTKQTSLKTLGIISLKTILGSLILMAVLLFTMSMPLTANAASLKAMTTVDSNHVTLGDLFEDVNNPNNIVGKAPSLGKELVINASTLKTIARKHSVNWTPASDLDQAIVRRSSFTLVGDDVVAALKEKLSETSKNGAVEITLNDPNISIVLPSSVTPTIEITSFNLSKNQDVFTADIAVPNKLNPVTTKRITGLITRTVSVPVLKNTLKKNDIISASDIDYINTPERTLMANAILDADDLIGMSPSRVITAGRVIKDSDIGAPQLVKRGDEVTIQYQGDNGMVLTAKGKASQHGAKGDFIRVTNLGSTKAISAEVTAEREVLVR